MTGYIVNKTDGTRLVEVADETINTSVASVALVGRDAVNYGQAFADNFIKLTQNFSNGSAPAHPLVGQLWYDSTNDLIKVNDGTRWVPVNGIASSATARTMISGAVGLVLDTETGEISVTAFFSEGRIIAVASHYSIAFDNLPDSVSINGTSYPFQAKFPVGISSGLTLAGSSYLFDRGTNWGPSRNLRFAGDVSGSGAVDGSANVTISLTLDNSGVSPGSYKQVTVDAKGRVTGGTNPPDKIISLTGDVSGTSNNTGEIAAELSQTGVTAGLYGSSTETIVFSVDAKGRISSANEVGIRVATTSQTGIVQLSSAIDSTSQTMASTPKAIKTVADRAVVDGNGINITNGTWSSGNNATIATDFATGQEALIGTSTVKVMSPATTKTLIAQEIAKYAIGDGHVATLNVPVGGIVIWSGTVASIPAGWALCDGSTITTSAGDRVTTPDLRNRFVVGAGADYSVGAKGGSLSASATTSTAGAHDHDGNTGDTSVVVPHTGWGTQGGPPGAIQLGALIVGSSSTEIKEVLESLSRAGGDRTTAAHSHTIGSDGAHSHTVTVNTIPPYYAMAYIMRVEIVQETVPEANHAANATTADRLTAAATIQFSGDMSGSATFNGASGTWSMTVKDTVATRWKATTAEVTAGTNDIHFVTPADVMSMLNAYCLGMNQTWQNLTAARTQDVWYHNTTGRSIYVFVQLNTPGGYMMVNPTAASNTGGIVVSGQDGSSGTWDNGYTIVPPGHYYKATGSSIRQWSELR